MAGARLWFQLVDAATRDAYVGTLPTLTTSNNIHRLRDAVFAQVSCALPANVSAADLRVFANRAKYDANGGPLESSAALVGLGMDDDDGALIVEVPLQRQSNSSSIVIVSGGKRQRTEAAISEWTKLVMTAHKLLEADVGTVVEMPKTVFGVSTFNGLYIRQEYRDLHELISQRLASDRSLRRVLVVGSPGIGKSVFGVFLLLLFMAQKRDVVYRALGDVLVYFSWNSTIQHRYEVSDTPLAGRSYVGFFDGNEAGGALRYGIFRHAFLFASDQYTTNFHEFVKEIFCFTVYMNPWTKHECQRFADVKQFDQDEWVRKFHLVGGKPRFLFSSCHQFHHLVKCVQAEIPQGVEEWKHHARLVERNVCDDRMTKHMVFHLYRDEVDPSDCYLAYASMAVEAVVGARDAIKSADQIRLLLLQTSPSNLISDGGQRF